VKNGLILGLMVLMTVISAPAVQAATIFNLTSDHCTGGCGPAGTIFGIVTLAQNGTTVDVTVHLNSPYRFAKTGSVDDQAFKFNATGVVLADITVDAHTPPLVADTGAFNGDGTGNFAFGIWGPALGGGLSDAFSNDIVFHVASAVIADLTAPNALGNVFVADVGNLAGVTGPIDASTPTVPEPATMILLGSGLIGLWGARKKFKK
jgi:hypothetical protein